MPTVAPWPKSPSFSTKTTKLLNPSCHVPVRRFGLGAAVATGAIALIALLAVPGKAQGRAAEVLAKGARALSNLRTVHFIGQMRTAPRDNFSAIMLDQEPVKIEMWKQFGPELK